MKLWLSKNADVPLQEQLTAQLKLGIASADLAPGERLPSSSQLARRFRIHPNTVRLAYRDLAREGWIEWRLGSGFFVCDRSKAAGPKAAVDVDHLLPLLLDAARRSGLSPQDLQARFRLWLSRKVPDRVLVVEAEEGLRKILVAEIQDCLSTPVSGIGPDRLSKRRKFSGVLCAALHDRATDARALVPSEVPWVILKSNSVPKALSLEQRPSSETLVTVVSQWSGFLHRAHATLVAVGIAPEAIDLLHYRGERLGRRLRSSSVVIADSLIGRHVQDHPGLRVFRIVSEESLEELRNAIGIAPQAPKGH